MSGRLRDDGRALDAFLAHIDVVCPRCSHRALVRLIDERRPGKPPRHPARLTCPGCGLTRTQRLDPGTLQRYAVWRDGRDPYFRLPLWLRTDTRHGVLFAYNAGHLDILEAYVSATLRERNADPARRWNNRSMAARLPRWIKLAAHRDELSKALERLRRRLQTHGPSD